MTAHSRTKRRFFALTHGTLAALVAACVWVGCDSSEEKAAKSAKEQKGRLVIPGSGACEGILNKLAAAFNAANPGMEVLVPSSTGSGGGVRSAGTGEAPIGRVGRTVKESESHYGLTFRLLAHDAVVFAVGDKVEVKGLTLAQIRDILTGAIENWKDVGGTDARIRVVAREPSETSFKIMAKKLEGFADLRISEQAKTVYHDPEMVDMLKKHKTAIGWLTNSSVNAEPGIHAIAIDGIAPSVENLRSGKYDLMCPYGLVYKKKNLNDVARTFLDFVFSDLGRAILEEDGLLPAE